MTQGRSAPTTAVVSAFMLIACFLIQSPAQTSSKAARDTSATRNKTIKARAETRRTLRVRAAPPRAGGGGRGRLERAGSGRRGGEGGGGGGGEGGRGGGGGGGEGGEGEKGARCGADPDAPAPPTEPH